MSDTTIARPLPLDRGQMRTYLPAEPTDTGVAQARAGARRLDQIIGEAAYELDQYDRRARAAAIALADAAITGDDLDPPIANLVGGKRHALAAKLDQLRAARSICTSRQQTQQSVDPVYTEWVATCQRIEDEWEAAMALDDTEQRFNALINFTTRHNPR